MNTQTKIIDVFTLVARLRWKYKNDKMRNDALNKLVWYSIPIVYTDDAWRNVSHKMSNRKQVKNRINRYLRNMMDFYDELWFVTFTFDNLCLDNTCDNTRHRYVSSFLNSISYDYFANVDYGDLNHREHFHAVVKLKNGVTIDIIKSWEFGFADYELIGGGKYSNSSNRVNRIKISKYLSKLTNHAGKLTTGKCFHKRFKDGFREIDNNKELPF